MLLLECLTACKAFSHTNAKGKGIDSKGWAFKMLLVHLNDLKAVGVVGIVVGIVVNIVVVYHKYSRIE